MFAPSVFQSAIFSDIAEGSGHSIIGAVAGSGKTTTLGIILGILHQDGGDFEWFEGTA